MSNGMLTKFETRSSRVKAVALHGQRPWVICGLQNGIIEIWDYRMRTCVDRYEEHTGPVRGVDFHAIQPIFASCGDDHTVRIWNYMLKRCLYVLNGHIDFVRSVHFHSEHPWVVSASDDHTVRIWNWQNRDCLSILTGHNHYVMRACFHPSQPLLLSGSTDGTVRVWDISNLYPKNQQLVLNQEAGSAVASFGKDIFGTLTDCTVKFILEGHDRGVTWCAFHPVKNIIVSASEDRTIRTWRIEDSRCIEIDQYRGHVGSVSCAIFYNDDIVSCSEDRTIRVWDSSVRGGATSTFRRETDRFWILAAQQGGKLIAAGHDSGVFVFKLERERPAFTIKNNVLYWVTGNNSLSTYDFKTNSSTNPLVLKRHNQAPRTISCNPSDSAAVFSWSSKNGFFELYTIPRPGSQASADVKKATNCTDAVFFSPGKFVSLDRQRQLVVKTTSGDSDKSPLPAPPNCNRVFPGPQGCVLLVSDDAVYLYHMAQKVVIAEAQVSGIRHVVWDKDFNRVALIAKPFIQVCSRKLKHLLTIFESTVRVKSAVFDEERDVLLYTTSAHLKYCSLRGSTKDRQGNIRTTEKIVYLVRACGENLWFLTRDGKLVHQNISNMELSFKLALQDKKFNEVMRLIRTNKLQGRALVSYLQEQGYPEIAMHFASDQWVRFQLAIDCGNMEIAKAAAIELKRSDAWAILAEKATQFGQVNLAELANTKIGNNRSLANQFFITGNMQALKDMLAKQGASDPNMLMHYSILTNDVETQVDLLCKSGQLSLAYTLARSNGMSEICKELAEKMGPETVARCEKTIVRKPLKTDFPNPCTDDWQMLPMQKSVFAKMLSDSSAASPIEVDKALTSAPKGAWGGEEENDDDLFEDENSVKPALQKNKGVKTGVHGGGAWGEEGDDLDDLSSEGEDFAHDARETAASTFIMPNVGEDLSVHWVQSSELPAFHIAAGSFSTALTLLQKQVGLSAVPPALESSFMRLWISCHATITPWSLLPSRVIPLAIPPPPSDVNLSHAPALPNDLKALQKLISIALTAMTEGSFSDARKLFAEAISRSLLCTLQDASKVQTLQNIISTSREYITALRADAMRKQIGPSNVKRSTELHCYFLQCQLQTTHLLLGLRLAMVQAFKAQCFKTAAGLAKRLLELDPPGDTAEKARKVYDRSNGKSDVLDINYDERNPFKLCVVDLNPIYRGNIEPVRCTLCFANAHPSHKGKTCPVCEIGTLGGIATGIVSGLF